MTAKQFVNSAYTLLVDGYQKIGMDLLSAVEKVNESLSLPSREQPAAELTDNERALKDLERLMGGLG